MTESKNEINFELDQNLRREGNSPQQRIDRWQSVLVWCLIGWLFVSQAVAGIKYSLDIDSSYGAYFITYFFNFGLIYLWLKSDSKKTHTHLFFDTGLFLFLAWPVVILVYLIRTRGWKAIRIIFIFICIFFGSQLLGMLFGLLV
jgi:hypothetical protein